MHKRIYINPVFVSSWIDVVVDGTEIGSWNKTVFNSSTMMFGGDLTVPTVVSQPEADLKTGQEPAMSAEATGPEKENEIQASVLSTRAKNALVKNGVTTIAQLKIMDRDQISNLSGLREKTINEIIEFLGK